MYEEKKVSINWVKIGLRIISVILIALIGVKVFEIVRDNRTGILGNDKMKEKIELLESAGKKYFKDELLPKEVGDSVTVTLAELIKEDLVDEIKDISDNVCNAEESNVKVIKLDSEYQYKSTLKCSSYEDYLNSFVEINAQDNVDKTVKINPTEQNVTTTKKSTVKTTSKKTTVRRIYTVSFNTNGGSLINDQYIKDGDVVISPGAPVRPGYRFVGWYYHGEPFDLNTKIKQNYVLVAKWIKD